MKVKLAMSSVPSIYFLCPDIDIPSGGINRLYRLAKVTSEGGYPACVLHERADFVNRWAPVVPPLRYWERGLNLNKGDVVVIPESEPNAMRHLPNGIRKIVLALDWSYIFENLPMGHRWADYGICQVLTCSGVVRDFISWAMDLPVYRIAVPIDHNLFYYDPELKKPIVAYMAHRNHHGEWVNKIFRQLPRPVPNWDWVGIRGLSVPDYAAVMRSAKIFVATGLREGVPGPILEAMASGTVVVGYGGVGGNEYLVPTGPQQNAFQVENDDYFALACVLEKVMHMVERKDSLIDSVRRNALATVQPLTFEREKASLLRFWEEFL